MFTKQLIQAISDWQRGGTEKQKKKRGAALAAEAAKLPEQYRTVHLCCFRQIALTGKFLMHMGTHYELTETISSWTKSENVAREFKGGVPPKGQGYQGVIFALAPPPSSVVLDLTSLFADSAFVDAVRKHEKAIVGYHDGMGKYWDSQQEVVMDIATVPLRSLYAWGGFSSDEDVLARYFFGYAPREPEMQWFRWLMSTGHIRTGAYWLTTQEAIDRTNERLKFHAKRLSQPTEA
jgi:hypothetical protein